MFPLAGVCMYVELIHRFLHFAIGAAVLVQYRLPEYEMEARITVMDCWCGEQIRSHSRNTHNYTLSNGGVKTLLGEATRLVPTHTSICRSRDTK